MEMNRQHTDPLKFPRSKRNHGIAALTSIPAGKFTPITAIPLLREDAMNGRLRVAVEMQETREILMNPVTLRVRAYCVPWLAFERFEGSRDQFDRSYAGEPQIDGGDVVDFIETHAMGTHGSKAVYKYLGLHGAVADNVNTMYLEAYNTLVNFLRKNRSPDLVQRTRLDDTLAEAFWQRGRFDAVVPDFDQAVIDGEVALNVVNAQMPVKGLGILSTYNASVASLGSLRESGGTGTVTYPNAEWVASNSPNGVAMKMTAATGAAGGFPDVYAEMQDNGITVSLSNIELAKKTQAFAKLRDQFNGFDDDYIIDMLMDGLTIPEQALKQPMLLADHTVPFSQVKRYATDAGNLAESAVSGGVIVDLNLRVPRIGVGAVVLVVAECIPEQLFERQRDLFFHTTAVAAWPEALRDTLDPEKVDVVTNAEIDTDHATPAGVFGYAPMNWKWNAWGPRVGGKFYRPTTDGATDTDRQRLWAVEAEDPVLGEDFYLVSSIHTKPFLDLESDPFEATVVGRAVIDGNTQFGGLLVEATDNYEKVLAEAPQDRIVKP